MARDKYDIKTAAEGYPVTVSLVKEWCRIGNKDDDNMIREVLIPAATEQLEKYTNRVFIQRTFTGKFDAICWSNFERFNYLELRRAPLVSVTSVKVESGGSQQAFTDFTTKDTSGFSRLMLTESLPTFDEVAWPIEVEFIAGYGASSTEVPEDIRTALKQTILFWYDNRGDAEAEGGLQIPNVVKSILNKYRILNTFA
jgi:uncharacterized phiE125 gp8 family phage protein